MCRKATTTDPADIIAAKKRTEWNGIRIDSSECSWQKFTTRLIAHGPIIPMISTSIHQLPGTDFYVAEFIALDINPRFDKIF